MKTTGKKFKRTMIALSAVLAFFVALFIFLMVWFFGAKYPEFQSISQEEFSIPGLRDSISPQGLCTLPEGSEYDFLMSGYMVDKSPSRVYLINSSKDESKCFTITRGGKAVTSHFGGVTATENYILIADGKKIARVSLQDALAAENGAALEIKDEFETGIQNAYCYYQKEEKLLFVGEFYRSKNYKTDESHHIEKDGETNYAFVNVYMADEEEKGGVVGDQPLAYLSVRGLVQGICVTQERIYLSCSYGLADSVLYTYSNPLQNVRELSSVHVFRLDKDNLISTLTMPCMSEEICLKDGKIYILYESLCDKYKYFVRVRKDRVSSIELDKIGVSE